MAEPVKASFRGYTGIDIASPAETVPPGKLRRAFGIDFSRERGAANIRRGQTKLNTTAITIWTVKEGYTCSGDEKHITAPSWRFTTAAADAAKSFGTQVWEKEQVEGATVFTTGQVVGIFAFEESNHGATNLPDSSTLHGLFRSQDNRYQRIGLSLYKGFSELYTGFSSARSQFTAYRPLNETQTWTFITDSTFMAKTDGSVTYAWGIEASTVKPSVVVGAGTGLTGNYQFRYTYLRKSGATVLQESNPSPVSDLLALTNQDVVVTSVVFSGDPQVTHIRMYRTIAGGSDFFFDQDITNDVAASLLNIEEGYSTSGDNEHITKPSWRFTLQATDTSKSFTTQIWEKEQVEGKTTLSAGQIVGIFDWEVGHGAQNIPQVFATSSQADNLLGSILQTDNDPPPKAKFSALYNEQILLDGDDSNPGYLWISKRFRPWSVPATSFLEMSADDPGRAIVVWGGIPIRFTRDTKYRIFGTEITNMLPVESHSRRGILPGKAWATSEHGVWYIANDGVFLTDGISDQWMSRDIDPIFKGRTVDSHPPINKSGNHVCDFFQNKLYMAYASGSNTEPDYLAIYDLATQGWRIEPMAVRSLFVEEATAILVRGSSDGFAYQMEDESATGDAGANISVDLLFPEVTANGPSRFSRYVLANADMDTQGGTVTLSFILDGTVKDSISLSASTRTLFREKFGTGRLGQRGQVRFEYAGTKAFRIGQVDVLSQSLGDR